MKRRLVATLLVLSVARAVHAADAPALAPPAAPPPPAPIVVPPAGLAPPAVVVAPLAPAPAPAPGGAAPLVAGALTAFVPFAVGCGLWSSNDIPLERLGTTFMAAGFAAAPWVSHGMQGRWRRAAVFGSVSAANAAAMLIAMEAKDPFVAMYANRQRVAFGVFLTSAMFAAAVSVFDSFLSAPAREAP
jgi:hypothetical protein